MKNDKNKTEEKNKITLEKLFELTEEKPFFIQGSVANFFSNFKKNELKILSENFVLANNAIISYKFVLKYIEKLLRSILSRKNKISALDFEKEFRLAFLSFYGVKIYGNAFYASIDPYLIEMYNIIDLPEVREDYKILYLFLAEKHPEILFKLGIKAENWEFIKEERLPFIYGAIKTFVESNVSKMSFEDFIFAFPKENFNLIIPMSDKEKVLSELKKYSDYFIVKNDEILITDFLDKTLNEIEKSKFPYGENHLDNTNSGVVAITLENGFSLFGEASEYVKLRNIIDVFATENFNEEIKKYFEPSELTANNLTSLLSEPLKLSNNRESLEKVKNWMRENFKIAFIEKDYENAKVLEFAIGIDRAPLLKTEDVYENIFATMIKEKKSKFEKVLAVKDEKN